VVMTRDKMCFLVQLGTFLWWKGYNMVVGPGRPELTPLERETCLPR
jgi:hypothetical protein